MEQAEDDGAGECRGMSIREGPGRGATSAEPCALGSLEGEVEEAVQRSIGAEEGEEEAGKERSAPSSMKEMHRKTAVRMSKTWLSHWGNEVNK